jgi:hypothetical protein
MLSVMPFWPGAAPVLYSLNALHLLSGMRVAYIEIPKNASTVVKEVIWRLQHFLGAAGRVGPVEGSFHRSTDAPWVRFRKQPLSAVRYLASREVRVFTVVRAPETRILSAYLDKILDINRQPTTQKQQLRRQFGFESKAPTFEGFLERLQDERLLYSDKHFMPQWDLMSLFRTKTTCLRMESPRLIHDVFEFIAAGEEVSGFDRNQLDRIRPPHPTHASTRQVAQEFLSPRARGLIEAIYEKDFELLKNPG